MRYLFAGTAAFFLDSAIKEKVEREYEDGEEKELCHGKVRIQKYHNRGAALNILEKRPLLMRVIHTGSWLAAAGYLTCQIKERGNVANKIGAGLLLAGGLNNLCDRYRRGYVVDYLRFQTPWKRLNRMIFNLSDFYVFFGALLMLLTSRKIQGRGSKRDAHVDTPF